MLYFILPALQRKITSSHIFSLAGFSNIKELRYCDHGGVRSVALVCLQNLKVGPMAITAGLQHLQTMPLSLMLSSFACKKTDIVGNRRALRLHSKDKGGLCGEVFIQFYEISLLFPSVVVPRQVHSSTQSVCGDTKCPKCKKAMV